MPKNRYSAVMQIRDLKQAEKVRHHTRVFMMDMVTIALGRMGFGEKRFEKLDEVLTRVSSEYSKLIVADAKDDPDIVYAKSCLDREISQYVGKRFLPYDERYA